MSRVMDARFPQLFSPAAPIELTIKMSFFTISVRLARLGAGSQCVCSGNTLSQTSTMCLGMLDATKLQDGTLFNADEGH